MNEKAKCKNCTDEMIEEMAKSCCSYKNGRCMESLCIEDVCDMICEYGRTCKKFYDLGYRKIPEGSVVLTSEEYKAINMDRAVDILREIQKQARKETAEKFAEMLKEEFEKSSSIQDSITAKKIFRDICPIKVDKILKKINKEI